MVGGFSSLQKQRRRPAGCYNVTLSFIHSDDDDDNDYEAYMIVKTKSNGDRLAVLTSRFILFCHDHDGDQHYEGDNDYDAHMTKKQ